MSRHRQAVRPLDLWREHVCDLVAMVALIAFVWGAFWAVGLFWGVR